MRLDVDQPAHRSDCDQDPHAFWSECRGCTWLLDLTVEAQAWERWVMLFKWVAADSYRPQGMGRG